MNSLRKWWGRWQERKVAKMGREIVRLNEELSKAKRELSEVRYLLALERKFDTQGEA